MADDIESWEIFVSLYKTGSIGLTAQELNVDAPTVSKKISVLEKNREMFILIADQAVCSYS